MLTTYEQQLDKITFLSITFRRVYNPSDTGVIRMCLKHLKRLKHLKQILKMFQSPINQQIP